MGGRKIAQKGNEHTDKNLPLIEYDPPQFLLANETVDIIVDNFVKEKDTQASHATAKDRTISIGISFIVSIFCSFNVFISLPQQNDIGALVIYILRILAMGAIGFWLVSCCVVWYRKGNEAKHMNPDIRSEMKAGAKEKINYTAILIIATTDGEGKCRLFVDKRGKSEHAYFLPYCMLDKKNSIQYQGERIKAFVSSHYGLKLGDILGVTALSEVPVFSIKATQSGTSEEQHAFVFFHISLLPSAKTVLEAYGDGEWYTINNLKANPQAIERNGDVINTLDEHPEYITDSFVGEKRPLLKIIWNITKECGYNCEICATHDSNRRELSLEEKLRAWQSILTVKDGIGLLDFAGGDPCKSKDSLYIAQEAIQILGEHHVSITTTGNGIEHLDAKQRKILLKRCEITIDIEHPGETSVVKRAASGYVESNIDKLETYGDDIQFLTINMPIIHTDLSESEIDNIAQKVLKVKGIIPKAKISVSFLRLMPVGRAGTTSYPMEYSPWKVLSAIRSKLEPQGIECTSHCSLNVCKKDEIGDGCGRLEFKLGIDCAGNVFACAWAGYLSEVSDVAENPFYIGNLLELDLKDILSESINQNPNYKKMCKYNPRTFDHCPLISYVKNKKDPHKNTDPLSSLS